MFYSKDRRGNCSCSIVCYRLLCAAVLLVNITVASLYCDKTFIKIPNKDVLFTPFFIVTPILGIILLSEITLWILCVLINKNLVETTISIVVLTYNFSVMIVVMVHEKNTTMYGTFTILFTILIACNILTLLCVILSIFIELNIIPDSDFDMTLPRSTNEIDVVVPKWTTIKPTTVFNDEVTNDNLDCDICMDNAKNVIFVCGHYIYCDICAEKIYETNKTCPLCKQYICPMFKVVVLAIDD